MRLVFFSGFAYLNFQLSRAFCPTKERELGCGLDENVPSPRGTRSASFSSFERLGERKILRCENC